MNGFSEAIERHVSHDSSARARIEHAKRLVGHFLPDSPAWKAIEPELQRFYTGSVLWDLAEEAERQLDFYRPYL